VKLGSGILDALRTARRQPTAAIVAYVANAIEQPDAREVIAKTEATNLRYNGIGRS